MKYRINWTCADGTRVEDQVYTADRVSYRLVQLEAEGCTDITVESFEEKSLTDQALDKLPGKCCDEIERCKTMYNHYKNEHQSRLADETRHKGYGYVSALCDAGIISMVEFRLIYGYITV